MQSSKTDRPPPAACCTSQTAAAAAKNSGRGRGAVRHLGLQRQLDACPGETLEAAAMANVWQASPR